MTASALPGSAAHTPSEVLQRARSDPRYAAFLLLRIGFTVLPIVFGLDKFTNVLTNWEAYLAPWIVDLSPISAHQVMLVVGVIESWPASPWRSSRATPPTSSPPGWPASSSTW